MDRHMILLPVLAQVLLTAIVWGWMYYTRLKEIYTNKIPAQLLADTTEAKNLLKKVSAPSNNLINLFEVPILFFTAMIILYITDLASYAYFVMAIVYVVLRYIHSFIHIVYNKVIHRFTVYFLSTVVLWIIWIMITIDIIGRI